MSDEYSRGWDDGYHGRRPNPPSGAEARLSYEQGWRDGRLMAQGGAA
jgi:hypothetical protein